jgi:pantothenate kinase
MAELVPFNFVMPDLVADHQRGDEAAKRALDAINGTCNPDVLHRAVVELIGPVDVGKATRLRAFLRVIQKDAERHKSDVRRAAGGRHDKDHAA